MKVLDLFSGTGNFSQGFVERGDDVLRVEKSPSFASVPFTRTLDVFDYNAKALAADVVVASPPCDAYTMAGGKQSGLRWIHAKDEGVEKFPFFGPRLPRTVESLLGVAMVLQARRIIDRVKPKWFFIENPQGGLQTMGFMDDLPRVTVTYCQYGEARMKPTTVFGWFPPAWRPRARCFNGDKCHPESRRGWKTGTQGLKSSAARSAVPLALSREIAAACAIGLA